MLTTINIGLIYFLKNYLSSILIGIVIILLLVIILQLRKIISLQRIIITKEKED
jgi:hypothetical protein